MAKALKTIKVQPGTELARLLQEAAKAPVLLENNGERFRVAPEELDSADPWAGYDPQAVKAALRQSAGALRGVDTKLLLRDIRAARAQHSHGRPECRTTVTKTPSSGKTFGLRLPRAVPM